MKFLFTNFEKANEFRTDYTEVTLEASPHNTHVPSVLCHLPPSCLFYVTEGT